MSDSVQPCRWQPTRLCCPWDSPGKNAVVGCHFFLQCMKVNSESEVAQSCLTRSDPTDCSPPGSSVHGIFYARTLEWGAIAFSLNVIMLLYSGVFVKTKEPTAVLDCQLNSTVYRDFTSLPLMSFLCSRISSWTLHYICSSCLRHL